jgi:hypothetical protein
MTAKSRSTPITAGSLSRRAVLVGLTATAAVAVAPGLALAAAAPYEAVHYWSKIVEGADQQIGGAPGPLARSTAIMHLAMYDAANSITPIGQPYLASQPLTGSTSLNAAIATAAYTVLHSLYPNLSFDGNYGFALSNDTAPQADKDRGVIVGRAAANAMLAARSNDGSTASPAYALDDVPGSWRPTDHSLQAATPHWGNVLPFSGFTSGQFRASIGFTSYPAMLASAAYAAQVDEVRKLGGYASTALTTVTRTAEQTEIAKFWSNDLDGTYKPPAQLFQHTRIIARNKGLTVTQNVKLFAALSIALADAAIVAWDTKYKTPIDLWRPVSAINQADIDGNPTTTADTAWRPLSSYSDGSSFTPPFPAFISGHATFAGAWAEVMRAYFQTDAITFSATTNDSYDGGIYRRFTSLAAAANENAVSRIYLGVHYRWDSDQGLAAGKSLAQYVSGKYL